MKTRLEKTKNLIEKTLLLSVGAFLVAIALEIFLIPNNIIDGGVVGVSIMASYLSKIPLGAFIFCLNLPFLILGYKKLGKNFIFTSLYCITLLSILVSLIHGKSSITEDVLLASIFGGIILGIGLGMILRNNGSLDGTEMVAILLNKKTSFSVGEIIMFINIFVLGSAGFVFGWDRAMYSLLTYFIIFKTVDVVIDGLDESKSIIIISDEYEKIAKGIMEQFQRGVTYIDGQGAYTGEKKKIIFCVVSRLELANLKSFILDVDESAFIAIENVHEVEGGICRKDKLLKKEC